jgi:hypothetical protein
VSTAKIEVGYDGDGLRDGTMDVRDLAPALLAVGELLQEANNVLNDGRGRLTTHVRSDFKTGSFEIKLKLVQDLAEQISFALEHCKHWTAGDVSKFVGLSAASGISLITLLKRLGKRKIKSSTVIENGNIKIETEGNFDTIEVSPEVVRLAKNQKIRSNLMAILKPLENLGVQLFYAKDNGKEVERVSKEEVPAFELPPMPEQELVDSTRQVAVHLIEVCFEEGLKWKLYDGENRINAAVLDKGFLQEIEAGKKFAKGDILVVELRTRQANTGDKIKNEHEVVKVTKHIPAEKQSELPLSAGQPSASDENSSSTSQT